VEIKRDSGTGNGRLKKPMYKEQDRLSPEILFDGLHVNMTVDIITIHSRSVCVKMGSGM